MKRQKTEQKIDLTNLHISSAAMSLAALLTVFHLQFENSHKHAIVAPADISSLFEREREIHPAHGSYGARARYATVTG